jgi:hypothetical protein
MGKRRTYEEDLVPEQCLLAWVFVNEPVDSVRQ